MKQKSPVSIQTESSLVIAWLQLISSPLRSDCNSSRQGRWGCAAGPIMLHSQLRLHGPKSTVATRPSVQGNNKEKRPRRPAMGGTRLKQILSADYLLSGGDTRDFESRLNLAYCSQRDLFTPPANILVTAPTPSSRLSHLLFLPPSAHRHLSSVFFAPILQPLLPLLRWLSSMSSFRGYVPLTDGI